MEFIIIIGVFIILATIIISSIDKPKTIPHIKNRDSTLPVIRNSTLPVMYGGEYTNCSICFKSLTDQIIRKCRCSHEFHIHHINEWLIATNKCPMCQEIWGDWDWRSDPELILPEPMPEPDSIPPPPTMDELTHYKDTNFKRDD